MLSASTKYAIRALLTLRDSLFENGGKKTRSATSRQICKELLSVDEIAALSKTPRPYLAKVIKLLGREGFVKTRKGPGGGVCITKRGLDANLLAICEIMSEPLLSETCAISRGTCSSRHPCALHDRYKKTRAEMMRFLRDSEIRSI